MQLLIWGSLLIAGLLFFALYNRRIYRKNREIFNILPGRVGVMDRNEKILFLKTEESVGFESENMRELKDIPGIDYQKISDFMQLVFRVRILLMAANFVNLAPVKNMFPAMNF